MKVKNARNPTIKPNPSSSTNTKKASRKNLLVIAGIVVTVLVLAVLVYAFTHRTNAPSQSEQGPLIVDGTVVSLDEFQFAVDTVKNDVLIEQAPNGSSVGPEFWQDVLEGSASYIVAERAVQVVEQRYAFYRAMVDADLVDDASWESLYLRFEQENASRQSNQSSGDPVYGLETFDLPTFVTYEQGILEEQYVNDQDNPGMDVSEDQIQRHFESKQWTLEDQSATLDQVRSNVVDDLRHTVFQDMVTRQKQQMHTSADLPSLAVQVAGYLG